MQLAQTRTLHAGQLIQPGSRRGEQRFGLIEAPLDDELTGGSKRHTRKSGTDALGQSGRQPGYPGQTPRSEQRVAGIIEELRRVHDVAGKHRMLTGFQGAPIGSQPTTSAAMAVHLLRRRQLPSAGPKELAELKMEAEPSRLFLMYQKESIALTVLQQPRAVG